MRAVLIVAGLMACRPAPDLTPFTLRIAVSGPLEPVTPSLDVRSWTVIVQPLVFEPLVSLGPSGEIVPVLASRAGIVDGGRFRVWLRSQAQFSDGSPVTFKEVAESLASNGLRATDEGGSMLIGLEERAVPIELLLSQTLISRHGGEWSLGTAAFAVKEQDATHILLKRIRSAPRLVDQVRLDSYPTPEDTFARTLKGDADMLPEVQPRWVEFFQDVPRLRILRAPSNYANMVVFSPARLSAPERRALASSLAGEEIRKLAFGDDCASPAQRPEIKPLPPGRPLEVLAVPFLDRFGFAVRRALGPRGGTVRVAEVRDFLATLRSGAFDVATFRPQVSPPIVATLNWRTGAVTNLLGYSDAAVDAALDARDWIAAQRALEDDPPGVMICTPPSVVVLDSRIRTPPLGAGRFLQSLPQWEIAE